MTEPSPPPAPTPPPPQVTGALGAPSAPPVAQSAPNLAIDLGVLALMGYLYKREEDARTVQMSRISREERLGSLRVRRPAPHDPCSDRLSREISDGT